MAVPVRCGVVGHVRVFLPLAACAYGAEIDDGAVGAVRGCVPGDRAAAAASAAGRVGCVACGGAVRRVAERRHRGVVEGGDVAVIADGHPGAVGGEAVTGDHDPRRWWRCRWSVAPSRADDGDRRRGRALVAPSSGSRGTPPTPARHDPAFDGQRRRERRRRDRSQRFASRRATATRRPLVADRRAGGCRRASRRTGPATPAPARS